MSVEILQGDALDRLRELPDESVQCCVTSPPYFGLRNYNVDGQLGLEKTPQEYIEKLTAVFREVRRILRKEGTCWLNLGDSYASNPASGGVQSAKLRGPQNATPDTHAYKRPDGLKPKDLMGMPWRLAFALQDDGWYLRSDIIWAKPNPMPESVTDRPTKSHEYIFLLTKSAKYFYDADAISEDFTSKPTALRDRRNEGYGAAFLTPLGAGLRNGYENGKRNARTVWTIATKPFKEAHFATFPPEIPNRCILAGCPVGGTVLDPFLGSGTTLAEAVRLGRNGIGIELNPEYIELARQRIADANPSLFVEAL